MSQVNRIISTQRPCSVDIYGDLLSRWPLRRPPHLALNGLASLISSPHPSPGIPISVFSKCGGFVQRVLRVAGYASFRGGEHGRLTNRTAGVSRAGRGSSQPKENCSCIRIGTGAGEARYWYLLCS